MTRSIAAIGDEWPLRPSQLQLLKDAVTIQGSGRVANQVGTAPEAIDAYVGGQPPSASDRAAIIDWLVRSGLFRPRPGDDPHRPDGSIRLSPELRRQVRARNN